MPQSTAMRLAKSIVERLTWDFRSAVGGAGAFFSRKTKYPCVKFMVATNLLGHMVHFSGPYPMVVQFVIPP